MKAIVYIITKLELGGAQKVCVHLFKHTPPDTTTYLITGTQGILLEKLKNHPNIILLPSLTREISKNPFKELETFFYLIKALRKLRKKHSHLIVHTHSTKAGIMGRWAAWCARVSVRIHTIHGYGFHEHQNRISWTITYLLEWITSFITTHFICVSQKDQQTGTRYLPAFKSSLIRASVEDNALEKVTTNKRIIFGSIACFKPQKNIFDTLYAFQKMHVQYPNCALELIGDGIERTSIEQWIKTHALDDVIILHGWQDNIWPFLARWNAFVLSSLWEGLPCAIVEARMAQLPVISYRTGGIDELIMHNKNGLLYTQKDWHSLSQGMTTIVQDPQLRARLSAYKDSLTPFKLRSMIEAHHLLYNSFFKKLHEK